MGLTVSDILKLPSLRSAKVVAGRKGLSKVISSITVLECTDIDETLDNVLQNTVSACDDEIAITSFSGVRNDVEAQCTNIRRMSAMGSVGLILYYVGIVMPYIDKKLIQLADSLNFVLICMPKNRSDLRYIEVITDVMKAVFKDNEEQKFLNKDTHFQSELIQFILQNKPTELQNLIENSNIDTTDLNTMYLITPIMDHDINTKTAKNILNMAKIILCSRCSTVMGEIFGNNIVLLIDSSNVPSNELITIAQNICKEMKNLKFPALLTVCFKLNTFSKIRSAFLFSKRVIKEAVRVFPHKKLFTYSQLEFVEKCQQILDEGEYATQKEIAILELFKQKDRLQWQELCETLAVYMLDSQFDIALTAEKMSLHKNTIKYRLKKIEEYMGCNIDKMPESSQLYTALALKRMLNS